MSTPSSPYQISLEVETLVTRKYAATVAVVSWDGKDEEELIASLRELLVRKSSEEKPK